MNKQVRFNRKVIYHAYDGKKAATIRTEDRLKSILKKRPAFRQKPNASCFTNAATNAYKPLQIKRQSVRTTFKRYQTE